MKPDLKEADVERIWEHNVRPYIQELLFSYGGNRVEEFTLENLRRGREAGTPEDGDQGSDNETASDQ